MLWAAWLGLLTFMWGRASIGLDVDELGLEHVQRARAAGFLTGIYHALHEGWSARRQARLFFSLLDPRDKLPPALDVERSGLGEQHVVDFLDEWARLGGPAIVIYTSAPAWHAIVGRGLRLWARRLLLWVAGYPFDPDGPVHLRSTPPNDRWPAVPDPWAGKHSGEGRPDWDWWQHTGNGRLPGYGKALDLNVFWGPLGELRALFDPALEVSLVIARCKVGPQLDLEGHPDATAWLVRGRPALAVGINIGPPGEISGQSVIWGARNFEDTFQPKNPQAGGYSPDPVEAARQWARTWWHEWLTINRWIQYPFGPNEPVVDDDVAAMQYLDRFHAELIRIGVEEYGRRPVVGHFAVGTPHYWLWQHYTETLGAIARYGVFHARHSYGESGEHQADYALRHRKDAQIFAALGFPRVPTLITECGWENLPEVGQRAFNVEPRRSDEAYAAHLAWLNDELMKDDYVFGASVFVYSPGWGDHRLNASRVGQLCASQFERQLELRLALPQGGEMPMQYLLTVADSLSSGEIRERLEPVNVFDLRVVVPIGTTPEPPKWWETMVPPYQLKATGAVIPFYNADGTPRITAPTSRAITGNWDVWERRANLLRVTDFRDPARPDWWVRAEAVQPK